MSNQVFIPSRGRWEQAKKLIQPWVKEGFGINFVVEPSELLKYEDHVGQWAKVYPLRLDNLGIGNSRGHCVELAASFGLRSFILADDDIKPARVDANMAGLVECAAAKKVMGITARYSYHDLCLGGDKIKGRDDLILLPTGTFRLVALNVNNVLDLGNYDKTLEYAEDCDLFLRGLQAGYPWMVHLGTYSNSIGTRYEPGGMLDFACKSTLCSEIPDEQNVLQYKKADWHKRIHDKWPEFVNEHTAKCAGKQNCIRISWRKAYDTYIPDWKKYSMLHGGFLYYYLNGLPS